MNNEIELSAEVIAQIQANRKVSAIKLVRQQHNLGLKEAKEVVDTYMGMHPESSGQDSTPAKGNAGRLLFAVLIGGLAYSLYRYFS